MAWEDREKSSSYQAPRLSLTVADFDIQGRLGEGSFSTVILATHRATGKKYAVKIINKHVVMRNKMVDYIRNERNILDKLDYDGVVKLYFTFQDSDSLYMGLEYCPGGELYSIIQKRGALPMADAQFYAAEVVDILEYLREQEVIHRDLKPENLLIAADGHLKLTDFGSAKAFFLPPQECRVTRNRATSFIGTAEYVSPEVLNNTGVSYASDLWALGCMIFQFVTGKHPFRGGSEYLTFQLVTHRDFTFPEDCPPVVRSIVDALLQLDPWERLGARDLMELKQHPFFEGIDWANLRRSQAPEVEAPAEPELDGLDWEMTSLTSQIPVRYEYVKAGETV